MAALMKLENIRKHYRVQSGVHSLFHKTSRFVHAVDDINLEVKTGETMCLVGETGCGKTTTAKIAVNLTKPTYGKVFLEGHDVSELDKKDLRSFRSQVQMIFQNPFASLNPRSTVLDIVGLPLEIHKGAKGDEKKRMVVGLLEKVGLFPGSRFLKRLPHEFSGGQRQRIGIARSIASSPRIIVADEPVSALDVSIRIHILNLLRDLRRELDLAYLLIAHDLSVVKFLGDRMAVMYLGKIVEQGDVQSIFASPLHPYTKALLAAVPVPDPFIRRKRFRLKGHLPSPIDIPKGCRFHSRCPFERTECGETAPELVRIEPNHLVSCHMYGD